MTRKDFTVFSGSNIIYNIVALIQNISNTKRRTIFEIWAGAKLAVPRRGLNSLNYTSVFVIFLLFLGLYN